MIDVGHNSTLTVIHGVYFIDFLDFTISVLQRHSCRNLHSMMHVCDDPRYVYVNVSVWIAFTYNSDNRLDMEGAA